MKQMLAVFPLEEIVYCYGNIFESVSVLVVLVMCLDSRVSPLSVVAFVNCMLSKKILWW